MQTVSNWVFRFLLVLFIIAGASESSYSQKFQKGFIVKASGDTTQGYLNYRLQNSREVEFKTTPKGELKKYGITQISAFGFGGGRFYTTENFNLDNGQQGVRFLENLVIGELSLYKDDRVFIFKKGDQISRISKVERSNTYEEQSKQKRQSLIQVSQFLSGCSQTLIEQYGFEESEKLYITLIKAYNDCVGASYVEYNSEKPWVGLDKNFFLGFSNSNLEFTDNVGFRYVDRLRFDAVSSIFIGTELKFSSPRINKRLGLILGVQYHKMDFYGFATEGSSFNSTHNDLIFRTTYLKFPIALSYSLQVKSWPINLKVGPHFNSMLDYSQERTEYQITVQGGGNGLTVVTEYSGEIEHTSLSQGFWFGIGTERALNEKLSLFVDLRIESNSSFTALSSKTNSVQLLLGLKL